MKLSHFVLPESLPSRLFGSAGLLISGTFLAQVILVVSSPILLRLYSPSDVGSLAAIMGLLSVVTVISSCRYELAIPLAEHDDEAAALVVLSLSILTVTSFFTWITVFVFGRDIGSMAGAAWLGSEHWLIPLGLLATGLYSIFNYWCVRKKQFAAIARATAVTAVATTLTQLLLHKFGFVGLLTGQVTGQIAGVVALVSRTQIWPILARSNRAQILWQAKRHRNFPVYSTWEGLVNTASHQVAPIGLAFAFGSGAAGVFAIAHRFLGIPASLVGLAVGNVFFASVAKQSKTGIRSEFTRTAAHLSLLGMPAITLLAVAAPPAIRLLFGAEWEEVGRLAGWMAPWFYLQLISSPMSLLFSATERQKEGMIWQLQLLLLRLAAIGIGAGSGSAFYTVIWFSLASATAYFVQLMWLTNIAGASKRELLGTNIRALAGTILICSPVWIAGVLFERSIEAIWVGILGGVLLYFGYTLLILLLSKPSEKHSDAVESAKTQ
jgi:O-antigen/teichoic acid export membrane protein